MRIELKALVVLLAIFNFAWTAAVAAGSGERWRIGTPLITYFAGPGFPGSSPLDDRAAKQMAEGGFNLVWSDEGQLEVARRHGLRVLLTDGLISRPSIDDPVKRAKLDALIERVRRHPAFYAYFIIDEPNVAQFPDLGRLVAYLRERDPVHLAYINLYPTYANNDQLGTKGDTITAYREYLRLFIEQVKPDILSYDHYHFRAGGKDGDQYFLNLGMVRQAALDAGLPFMNIVQGCAWDSNMRAPKDAEMRWLNYTSLAYGAQGLSYFVYYHEPSYTERARAGADPGGMMRPDGSTTAQYAAARGLNPQFVAVASQLRPLRSLGAYHVGTVGSGAVASPKNAPFHLDLAEKGMPRARAEEMLLGYFGKTDGSDNITGSTHVLVVNRNYKDSVTTTVVGPGVLFLFDAVARKWTRATGSRVVVTLPPGGGKLIRVQ